MTSTPNRRATLKSAALALCALALTACVSNTGPTEPYAFVGTWSCEGGKTLTFTDTTYDDGAKRYPIQTVARDGMNYTLRFANGSIIALAAVTETGLTRVSGQTGAQLNCARAG
jgi:hypothetical protein